MNLLSNWEQFKRQFMPHAQQGARYAVVDSTRHAELYNFITEHAVHQCLYSDIEAIRLARYAPYCVDLDRSPEFVSRWFAHAGQGWHMHWGWLFQSRLSLAALQHHFKKISHIQLPNQQPLLWRFYDPRVLKKSLPGLSQEQTAENFGALQPIVFYQSESSRFVQLTFDNASWLGARRPTLHFYKDPPA